MDSSIPVLRARKSRTTPQAQKRGLRVWDLEFKRLGVLKFPVLLEGFHARDLTGMSPQTFNPVRKDGLLPMPLKKFKRNTVSR